MGDKMGLGRGKRWIYPDKMKQNKETGDAFSGLSPTSQVGHGCPRMEYPLVISLLLNMAHLQLIYLLKMVDLSMANCWLPEGTPLPLRVTTRLKPGSNGAEVAGKWYPGTRHRKAEKHSGGVQWGNPQGEVSSWENP